jgi:hypothetical protein
MKNWRTRKGVVWRSASGAGSSAEVGVSVMTAEYIPGPAGH